ncbi:MAG: hypothetical protein ACRYFZ_15995 [Janthinobacterium lividum]
MLPLPNTLRSAFGKFAAYLKKLQSELPAQLRTRTVKGQLQHYLVRPKALSDGAQATARLLLVYAINAVEQLRRVPLLLEAATDQAPHQRTPPPVATNNEALARARNVSARAIRDHLQELLKIGFLTRKANHGWQANFELYLAPEFVWQQVAQNAPEVPKKRSYAPAAASAPATKVPPFVTLEKQDKKEIEIAQVEKLVTHECPGELTGNTGPQAHSKPAPPRPATSPQATKSGQGGAAAAEQQAERLGWVTQAWHYAWKRLYPTRHFDETEQSKALEAMWYGTYHGFGKRLTPAEWQRYHDQVLQRIDLAAAYFERHPNKFAPSPFAEFVKGTGYFDGENTRGFSGTEAWHARQEANNRQRNIFRALLKARQQLRNHRLGIAPKRTQALTSVQLFRYHEAKLRAYGPEALQRYYDQVANPTKPLANPISFTRPATA